MGFVETCSSSYRWGPFYALFLGAISPMILRFSTCDVSVSDNNRLLFLITNRNRKNEASCLTFLNVHFKKIYLCLHQHKQFTLLVFIPGNEKGNVHLHLDKAKQ